MNHNEAGTYVEFGSSYYCSSALTAQWAFCAETGLARFGGSAQRLLAPSGGILQRGSSQQRGQVCQQASFASCVTAHANLGRSTMPASHAHLISGAEPAR